jgi:hypothetical protein
LRAAKFGNNKPMIYSAESGKSQLRTLHIENAVGCILISGAIMAMEHFNNIKFWSLLGLTALLSAGCSSIYSVFILLKINRKVNITSHAAYSILCPYTYGSIISIFIVSNLLLRSSNGEYNVVGRYYIVSLVAISFLVITLQFISCKKKLMNILEKLNPM